MNLLRARLIRRVKPKKPKRPKMGIRRPVQIRCRPHINWVLKNYECMVKGLSGHVCEGRLDPHHDRQQGDAGAAQTPSDSRVVPLCRLAHREGDTIGWKSFETKYGVSVAATWQRLWEISPKRRVWELKMKKEGLL